MLNSDYSQIVKGITNTPWLILPESLDVMLEIINMRLRGEAYTDEEVKIRLEAAKREEEQNPRVQVDGGVGVIPVFGSIFPKANLMTEISGATSLETFQSDFRELLANDDVKQIVLNFDTPGGSAMMVPEVAKEIYDARDQKPIIGIANTMAASAGYYMLSQASKVYATPSAKVGSIGVRTVHVDQSKANEARGIKVTHIGAGDYKTAGNPDEPLSDKAREYIQESVNDIYEDFKLDVARGRGVDVPTVESNYGQARVFSAKRALASGMIDGIKTMDELLGELVSSNFAKKASSARGDLAHNVRKMHLLYGQPSLEVSVGDENPVEDATLVDKGMEHSEPGGIPRPPDESEKDTQDRIDTRPEDRDNVDESNLRSILGIDESASIEDAVQSLVDEVTPLREADAAAEKRLSFAQAFPEQAAQLEEYEAERRTRKATDFAESYFNLRDGEGKPTGRGFPRVAVDKIETLYLGMSEGTATHADLADLLNTIGQNGLVTKTETGSSHQKDTFEAQADPSKAFLDKVTELRVQDGLDHRAALKTAAEQNPDLYQRYREARGVGSAAAGNRR